ncbi:MAG: sugar ABC transporter ATP-binding protein [Propionibacteriaceae bacterium]|nr:sugar ABC transporter ATP-binding protein [Propionibacteriaceae bacterium]
MVDNVLTVRNVSKAFAGVKALKHIDLEIRPGEIHCLAGENGSGKSTLIKIISGVYTPDEGTIELNGQVHTRLTPIEAIMNGVQVIYQDFSVFPNLTVMENLAINTELAGNRKLVNWRRFRRIAEEAVAKINFQVDLDEVVGRLSVADKQLVAISRALMSDAKLIIMDEPTTALTKKEVDALFRIILDLKARGIATLFVSHKLEEVFEISERFTIIRNGESVITCLPAELDRKKFANYMTGRDFDEAHFTLAESSSEPILEAVGLGVEGAFSDVSFSLRRGEILGITGLLGSGRTELALTLFGALKKDTGELRIKGRPVDVDGIRAAIANGISYVPEDRLTEGLFLDRSIADNIVIADIDGLVSRSGMLSQAKVGQRAREWVDRLRIATPDPDNAASTLSGGNQQRIVLAKWLATDPEILILNGPTVGVDIGSKHDIHEILRGLARDGMAIIIISDDIPEVIGNCNRVLLMRAGRIEQELDPAGTTEAELAELMTREGHEVEGKR